MNWDYDKLFAEGNYIGTKDEDTGKVYYSRIDHVDHFARYQNVNFKSCYGNWIIWRIVKLNNDGEITEVVFDRQRDMPKPIPALKQGLMVEVEFKIPGMGNKLGIVSGNKIVYSEGGWSFLTDFDEHGNLKQHDGYIVAIFESHDFDCCGDENCVWEKI